MIQNIILPIVFLLIAGGVYFGLTDPLINSGESFLLEAGASSITELRAEKMALEQALDNASELEARAAELRQIVASLDQAKINRLDDFLPDSVDNLQLIVDVNGIASKYNMVLGEVTLDTSGSRNNNTGSDGGAPRVETTSLSFDITGTYGELKSFLRDLSTSLRLIDVTRLDFEAGDETGGEYVYRLTVETYWLK